MSILHKNQIIFLFCAVKSLRDYFFFVNHFIIILFFHKQKVYMYFLESVIFDLYKYHKKTTNLHCIQKQKLVI